jgi:hypothetical protein
VTEINIKRKSTSVVTWLVVILALFVVLWVLLGWGVADRATMTVVPSAVPTAWLGSASATHV